MLVVLEQERGSVPVVWARASVPEQGLVPEALPALVAEVAVAKDWDQCQPVAQARVRALLDWRLRHLLRKQTTRPQRLP